MRKIPLFLCLMLAAGAVPAGKIVKYTLPSGEVVYSDKPPPEATAGEEVKVEKLQSFSLPPAPPLEDSAEKKKDQEEEGYESFKVTSPANDSVIRDNGGNVRVSLSISPGLRSGHQIDVMVDGQSVGSGRGTSLTLTDMDRGTHTVQASIKDESGKEVTRSNSVIFHLKRGGG